MTIERMGHPAPVRGTPAAFDDSAGVGLGFENRALWLVLLLLALCYSARRAFPSFRLFSENLA
eukprot:2369238-Rhodomonas_salina.1